MLTQVVARHRGVATTTLGAMLIVVAAERTPAAQNSQPASTAPPASQSSRANDHAADAGRIFQGARHHRRRYRVLQPEVRRRLRSAQERFLSRVLQHDYRRGWVSAGPGYRHYFNDDQIMLDTSAALSWHLYKMGQARFELPTLANDHLVVGAQAMWQDATQVNYYGIGPDSLEEDQSQYRLQSTDFVGYVTITPNYWLSITGEAGWLMSPQVKSPGGSFAPNVPTTAQEFPNDPAVGLSSQPSFAHGEAAIAADTRDHRGYPHQRRPLPRGIDLLFRPARRDLQLP
jgi:hypothetical protein